MLDKAHPGILPRKVCHDLCCAVPAAVVYDNDLEGIGKAWQQCQRLAHHLPNVRFLIERGQDQ